VCTKDIDNGYPHFIVLVHIGSVEEGGVEHLHVSAQSQDPIRGSL
jgi:hypothetical protein